VMPWATGISGTLLASIGSTGGITGRSTRPFNHPPPTPSLPADLGLAVAHISVTPDKSATTPPRSLTSGRLIRTEGVPVDRHGPGGHGMGHDRAHRRSHRRIRIMRRCRLL